MSRLAPLGQELLQEEYEASPVLASRLGVDGYDDRLDDLSEAAFDRRRRRIAEWLPRFEALADAGLTPAERIDRDLVLAVLRGRAALADWEMWRRQPDTYLTPALDGVFVLFLHRLKPEAELVRAAAARLRAVPEALAAGTRNLTPELAPPVYVERALGQARAGAGWVRDLLPAEVGDPALRGTLAEAGAPAAAALEAFAAFLEAFRDRARGTWAIGEERYTRLLRERELLDVDARRLRERGRQEYEHLAERLREYARRLAGTDDWPRVLDDLSQDHPPSPEAMRAAYAEWTERARSFLRERGLVSLPEGEACVVEPSPLFQRPLLAVASYQGPAAFARSRRGHFFVPFPPDGIAPQEVRERLRNNHYAGIPTTAVHEAYPGHHWHLVMAKDNPSAVRAAFRTAYFTEGWALYAEDLMREEGFFADPRQEMSQVEAMLFRAARVVVDTSLHLGELGFDDAVRFMMERARLPAPTARAEVARYASWPTQAAAYLTGYLEIRQMRQRYLAHAAHAAVGGLRDFHDRLARTGALPLALAERALEEERGAG